MVLVVMTVDAVDVEVAHRVRAALGDRGVIVSDDVALRVAAAVRPVLEVGRVVTGRCGCEPF